MKFAAAAKSLQSCPTLCNPIDGSPPGSPVPGILQARVLEWGAVAFSDVKFAFYTTPEDTLVSSLESSVRFKELKAIVLKTHCSPLQFVKVGFPGGSVIKNLPAMQEM